MVAKGRRSDVHLFEEFDDKKIRSRSYGVLLRTLSGNKRAFVPHSMTWLDHPSSRFVFDSADLCDAEKSIHQKAK